MSPANTVAPTAAPHPTPPGRSLWAFSIDHAETVTVRYGTYQEALAWAKTQAHYRVEVLP